VAGDSDQLVRDEARRAMDRQNAPLR
jgi:hypothetical protein